MKYIILLFSIFSFFIPLSAHAAIDQRCFTKDECVEYNMTNGNMTREEANKAFRNGTTEITKACGTKDALQRDMGFCLPTVSTQTKTGFGQDNQFDNLGIFIQKMYKYGIGAAILIGIVMVLFAGLQWTASGGNPENINSAKKKIYGALGGIAIAVLSYTILNTINSNLVQLKLPEVWLINQQGLSPVYCSNLQSGMLAQAVSLEDKLVLNGEANQIQALREKNIKPDIKYDVTKENAECGFDYYVEETGGMTCRGQKCQDGFVCYVQILKHYNRFTTNVSKEYNLTKYFNTPNHVMETIPYCREGTIGGIIYNNNQLAKAIMGSSVDFVTLAPYWPEWWGWPWVPLTGEHNLQIVAGCGNGDIERLEVQSIVNPASEANQDTTLKQQEYSVKLLNRNFKDDQYCKGRQGVIGYALATELKEDWDLGTQTELHYIGKRGTEGVDLGDRTAFPYFLKAGNTNFTSLLFTVKDLEEGFMLNIDVDQVTDIDDSVGVGGITRRKEIYPDFF